MELTVTIDPHAEALLAMIRERDAPLSLFDLVPQLQLAFEPELAALDALLDGDALFRAVKAEMGRRAPHSLTRGRGSTPVEVVLRMLVVRRLYDWSDADTERLVGDSLVLRPFRRLYLAKAPDDTALIRWAKLVRPATLERLHAHVVALARALKVTRGRKLRTDGTVVEAAIRYPRDSGLLADGVRVPGRVARRAKGVVGAVADAAGELFRDRTRGAARRARCIGETARQRGEAAAAARRTADRRLLAAARASLRQAAAVRAHLAAAADRASQRLVRPLARFAPRVERVVDQAHRRVIGGQTVPAHEKVLSLFAPRTAVIRRGKAGHATEFGRTVRLDETDGGIVRRDAVLDGNPPDADRLVPGLAHHRRLFGRPPDLVAAARGVHPPANAPAAHDAGVRRPG